MSFFDRHKVDHTVEVDRILALPERAWTDKELETLASDLTVLLRTSSGTMRLRTLQALALHDLYCHGGLFGPLRVGAGKSLITFLAPYVVNARRPLLILPAGLISKAEMEMAELRKDWRIPKNIRITSYELLGRVSGAQFLHNYRPDLIMLDECHRAKTKKAGVTRRLTRYLKEYPDTKVLAVSGTIMKSSLRDFGHILRWALKDAPIPQTDGELSEWADALDEKVNLLQRRAPGALLKMCTPSDLLHPPIQAARLGFQRRLLNTPGVVASSGNEVACSLYIRGILYDTAAPHVDQHFKKLREEWVTPDGWDLMEAVEVWARARELSLGFHGVWNPRPPDPWIVARKIWAKFVRDTLSHSKTLDTELQVKHACQKGSLGDTEFNAWRAISPSFTPNPKDIWHDDAALKFCQDWLAGGPGIIWCEHTFFAKELAKRTGLSYYGSKGLDAAGNFIGNADPTKSMIASVDANSTGRNLQAWNRNLITSPPTGADAWEQLIGRTHREGQQADEVYVDVMLGCREHLNSWERAKAGAEMARDSLGQSQKILIADVVFPTDAEIDALKGYRWITI